MATVLIADDHAMVRAGLRRWLEQDRSVDSVGEAASGAETLQRLREAKWDLVVLDINMPDRSGIDIMRHIRTGHPETRVLVISAFSEKQYAVYALRAGACRNAAAQDHRAHRFRPAGVPQADGSLRGRSLPQQVARLPSAAGAVERFCGRASGWRPALTPQASSGMVSSSAMTRSSGSRTSICVPPSGGQCSRH